MHILIVTDQHPDSLGGVQVALRLQRRFLERAGHTVSIAAPALHRRAYAVSDADRAAYLDLPSRPITRDREYGITWPGRASDRALDRQIAARLNAGAPPVDLVHIQGDFWGALIGLRAARRHGLPVVFTMHNNVDHGTRAVTALAPLAFAALRVWRRLAVGKVARRITRDRAHGASGAWAYLAEVASEAALVTAPSQHFARELMRHGVADTVEVTPGGVDDDLARTIGSLPRADRTHPRFVWLGRMSSEKRILELVEAFALAVRRPAFDAELVLHGSGLLRARVERRIIELGMGEHIHVAGPVPYEQALRAMRDADALVQTSLGFETQGLTPFEAASLGTPTVFCDPNIAEDLAVTPSWLAEDGSVDALAAVLAQAASELAEASCSLRVATQERAAFLQSSQTAKMVQLYGRVLGRD